MIIKTEELDDSDVLKVLKCGLKRGGTTLKVTVNGETTCVRIKVRKVPKFYHRIEIDIDPTGYKISDEGRRRLREIIERTGLPDARDAKWDFINTYVLGVEVQREDERMRGEQTYLDILLALLEEDENLEKQKR